MTHKPDHNHQGKGFTENGSHISHIQPHNVELDNLFDLDADLDFETAYQLFSNFDNLQEKSIDVFANEQHITSPQYHNPPDNVFRGATHRLLADPLHQNRISTQFNEHETIPNYGHHVNNDLIHEHNNANKDLSHVDTTPHMVGGALVLQHQPNNHNILSPSPIPSPQFFNNHPHLNQNIPSLRNASHSAIDSDMKHQYFPQLQPQSTEELLQQINDTHIQRANDTLLSTFESTAIENFLDSLVNNQKNIIQEHSAIKSPNVKNEHQHNVVDVPLQEISQTEPLKTKEEQIVSQSYEEEYNSTEDSSYLQAPNDYIPPPLEIPEITISNEKIPMNLVGDEKKIKKWKHVQVEKARRDFTKQSFDSLTGMLSKDIESNTKRVPKYLLLNGIVDDIKSLLKANHQLEKMLYDEK
ncbi:some similarities with Saccharomyces cerevisiae YDR123C INO2 Component of the heteromeric Ino2p/Ino4p basic helix-loop-helix transcription activator that binds inositol/choline-responsive elements (ICREs) [Maudiozyma barnettii]|uniref:BHLH domain-containing protein n=1 Tax=Maudiozyma barnettii TaxID=61262 RepID=A0A8H2ZIB0_9SACH|nr:Ino2p [Kazachstania barnettii]CAB4255713.1 some similarities with Saccharomyces cerevisiae YDR123C INO2 Component of the heteromeric Ino2p/Ino4p basic helix-loop-helix transcription activator that binds inositol/choline-responsive elements (ICREs) [Kazachstania barnettii]CAD1784274.1 some similarities with Saccharomyces cerevisiae YDR123C INO2 Component of the heteromeric Ino2p/Ino4p basic helix-loop-helix transcription activator that binds inositol/choline-responsive elements (ICREs) [Kazachs